MLNERKNSVDFGRIKVVTISEKDFKKEVDKNKLVTTRSKIYYLYSLNYSKSGIATFLNKRYQHVRNELNRELKRK